MRTDKIIRVRVPSTIPVGSTVLLTPLHDSRADIGVLVGHSLQTVQDDGSTATYVLCKVINPHQRKVVLPLMTPLARFTADPKLAPVKPEFTVEEIIKNCHIGFFMM